jgi:hypothetical protein
MCPVDVKKVVKCNSRNEQDFLTHVLAWNTTRKQDQEG